MKDIFDFPVWIYRFDSLVWRSLNAWPPPPGVWRGVDGVAPYSLPSIIYYAESKRKSYSLKIHFDSWIFKRKYMSQFALIGFKIFVFEKANLKGKRSLQLASIGFSSFVFMYFPCMCPYLYRVLVHLTVLTHVHAHVHVQIFMSMLIIPKNMKKTWKFTKTFTRVCKVK